MRMFCDKDIHCYKWGKKYLKKSVHAACLLKAAHLRQRRDCKFASLPCSPGPSDTVTGALFYSHVVFHWLSVQRVGCVRCRAAGEGTQRQRLCNAGLLRGPWCV